MKALRRELSQQIRELKQARREIDRTIGAEVRRSGEYPSPLFARYAATNGLLRRMRAIYRLAIGQARVAGAEACVVTTYGFIQRESKRIEGGPREDADREVDAAGREARATG